MNAPNRSTEVAVWVTRHRVLFTGDADTVTRALLTPLAQHLNLIEGRDAWGLLVKTDRTPPFIPHDILMWKDTREHVDVFTGPDSGRAEEVQPSWGYNPAPDNPQWIWRSVEEDVADPPIASPDDRAELLARIAALEAHLELMREEDEAQAQLLSELVDRVRAIENAPAPTFELPPLRVTGHTSRVWGHAHTIDLEVVKGA